MKVAVVNRFKKGRPRLRGIKKKAEQILAALGNEKCELSVAFVGDGVIRALNARYRGKNASTDVLSFTGGEALRSGEKLLGDVVISVPRAAKQAREKHHSLERELEILLIHGILHLLGYDHERSRRDERVMQAMERKLLRALGTAKN